MASRDNDWEFFLPSEALESESGDKSPHSKMVFAIRTSKHRIKIEGLLFARLRSESSWGDSGSRQSAPAMVGGCAEPQ